MNNRLTIVLISILLLVFSVFFCCCGIDTSNIAGSASQVYQEEEPQDETEDEFVDENDYEDTDINENDETSESEEQASEELDEVSEDEEGPVITYVLNTNTMKFHYPDCRSVKQMKDKNKLIEETTREDLISRGYDPCGNCNP